MVDWAELPERPRPHDGSNNRRLRRNDCREKRIAELDQQLERQHAITADVVDNVRAIAAKMKLDGQAPGTFDANYIGVLASQLCEAVGGESDEC